MVINDFTRNGLKDLGPEAFAEIRQRIELVTIGCEFLVTGFDEQRRPHIFHVKERGIVDDHRRTGFWAIGSGEYAAISALVFHEYRTTLPVADAAYYVCMAKFMAERAELGEETDVGYLAPDGSVYSIDPAPIRQLWKDEGMPTIPAKLAERMPPFTLLPGSAPQTRALATRSPSKRGRKGQSPSQE
jgi:hypothetical protein